jgi:hypothetical protein
VLPALYRFMMDYQVRRWAVRPEDGPPAALHWQAVVGQNDRLWAAVPPEGSASSLTALLLHARRGLAWRQSLNLDFPAGEYRPAIEAAGFHPVRTLLWMKLARPVSVNPREGDNP